MSHPRSDRDFQAKKDDEPSHSKFTKTPSTSRHWSNYKNPRIVRVSRTFGGKDRHSKVCTIRGLRDRRIRLSVPTAIQLYDLQDRLGLSQPSKVVDWLLDVTKHDIDKLPPLPMLPIHQPIAPSHESSHFLTSNLGIAAMKEGIKISEPNNEREGFGGFVAQISAQNLFPLNNTTAQSNNAFPNFPYTSYFHWDPSNLSLSQSGGGFTAFANSQADDHRLALPSSSDLYFYPSAAAAMPSFNIPNASFPSSMENNDQLRQMNDENIPIALPTTLNLINPPVKSSSFGHHINSKSVYSLQETDARRLLKDNNKS